VESVRHRTDLARKMGHSC